MTSRLRYNLLDYWRFLAIILMVFFHFFYDLNYFGYVKIDFQNDLFWWFLPRLIVFLFLTAVGVSLRIVHKKAFKKKAFLKRFLKILFFAALISLSTYFMFPSAWVYFGTLHCIALSSLIAIPFISKPKLSLWIGLLLVIPGLFGKSLPWPELPHASMDYIPLFPWLGWVLLGVYAEYKDLHKISLPLLKENTFIKKSSQYSLWIYVVHQPILFSCVYIFSKIYTS